MGIAEYSRGDRGLCVLCGICVEYVCDMLWNMLWSIRGLVVME
jgi:hypothetical protein